jgi:hypothetical protein
MHATKLMINVPANHKLVIDVPADFPSGMAEVIILAQPRALVPEQSRLDRIKALPWFGKPRIDFDPAEPLAEDEWVRQVD